MRPQLLTFATLRSSIRRRYNFGNPLRTEEHVQASYTKSLGGSFKTGLRQRSQRISPNSEKVIVVSQETA